MPLFRLLIIALVVGAGFYLYRRLTLKPPAKKPPQVRSTQAVKCELCGLHIPEDEAIHRGNQIYCCQDHADKAAH